MNTDTPLDSAERVHFAMLEGRIARITMMQCAHTWGAEAVLELRKANELRADLKNVADVLMGYDGDTPLKQAQAVVDRVAWLQNELDIHKRYEQAALQTLEQTQAEMHAVRRKLASCRRVMLQNDPINARTIFGLPMEEQGHEQIARQTAGPAGKV